MIRKDNKNYNKHISYTFILKCPTRLEGSFGTEKEHYNLRKVKARTEETEILWILFGIHTANAIRLAARQQGKEQKKTA